MADIEQLIQDLGQLHGAGHLNPLGAPLSPTPSLGAIAAQPGPAILKRPLFDYSKLSEVPNVPQRDLERYVPPRGVPEETLAKADPKNLKRLSKIAGQGAKAGGLEWYNLEPLRQKFVEELGEEKGTQQFLRYLQLIAATSPRTKVPENVRNASYYLKALEQGEPTPQTYLEKGYWRIKPGTQAEYPYGMMPIHVQNVENILKSGGIPPLQNPKPASFVQNLAGNQRPVTIDTHNMRIMGLPRDVPKETEYGFLEKLQQREAEKLGMSPAQYQASLWLGGAEQTGVKSGADPALRHIEKRIELTAQKTGKTKEQVLKDMIRGRASLLTVPDLIPQILQYLRSKGLR